MVGIKKTDGDSITERGMKEMVHKLFKSLNTEYKKFELTLILWSFMEWITSYCISPACIKAQCYFCLQVSDTTDWGSLPGTPLFSPPTLLITMEHYSSYTKLMFPKPAHSPWSHASHKIWNVWLSCELSSVILVFVIWLRFLLCIVFTSPFSQLPQSVYLFLFWRNSLLGSILLPLLLFWMSLKIEMKI